MDAIESAVKAFAWDKSHTSIGDASFVPERLVGLVSAKDENDAEYWYNLLENYVVVQGSVFESALPSLVQAHG